MNKDEIETVAKSAGEAAARKAVRDTLLLFGVDVDDNEEVKAFRADLIHAHKLRRISERSGTYALNVIVITVVGAMLVAMMDSIKSMVLR